MRVCVVGMGPWPLERDAIVTGPAIRLRQFIEPMLSARHEVVAILLEENARQGIPINGTISACSFTPETILNPGQIKREVDLSHVGAMFGVGSLMPAVAALRLAQEIGKPCWVDYFGDPMAELHAAQLRQGGTVDLAARDHVWKFFRETLAGGDSFSTVSAAQRHALMGQLGLLGRFVNDWNVSQRIHEIPCGVPEDWTTPEPLPDFPQVLRTNGVKEGDPYVYFGGSWNVWLDEVTMGKALAMALCEQDNLTFVCCGIPTGRAGEEIKQHLLGKLQPYGHRVIDLPPQMPDMEASLLAHAGACLSLDRAIPEAELGSRNRLLAMVRWGARPVVSLEAGLESLLVAEGLAAGINGANEQRAAREVLTACARPAVQREEARQAGVRWLRTMTFEETMKPALAWLGNRTARLSISGGDGLIDRWRTASDLIGEPARKPARRKWFS
ncbi:hypothetical protein IT570_10270 [Candidatus Sumerlaeota bacterium]|nr:hypothetical protein [Candidatus Sumerlaeota bacterium]